MEVFGPRMKYSESKDMFNLDIRHQEFDISTLSESLRLVRRQYVTKCGNYIMVAKTDSVILYWIPGQVAIHYNDQAAELARRRASMLMIRSEPFFGVGTHICKGILNERERITIRFMHQSIQE